MQKKRILSLLLAGLCLLLCGCGNLELFDREYLSVTDYEIPVPPSSGDEDEITVRDVDELRQYLTALLDSRSETGRVVFDASYPGDISADIASVCWQVRTQNALFAYCVANISYDVARLVSHTEATFSIRYTESDSEEGGIVRLQLTTGLEDQLRQAIVRGDSRLVVLIGRSSLSAQDVEALALRVYRSNPIVEPRAPRVSVNMLSGTGMQRLYEINFNYSLSEEDLESRRAELQALEPFSDAEPLPSGAAERALLACEYLLEHASYSEQGQNDIYSALIGGEANSEGLALAYVELCRQLKVPCQIVYGQREWRNRCWDNSQIVADHYHVDVSACMTESLFQGFLLPDETMWSLCRWDISSYPPCSGSLSYQQLRPDAVPPQEAELISSGEEPSEP